MTTVSLSIDHVAAIFQVTISLEKQFVLSLMTSYLITYLHQNYSNSIFTPNYYGYRDLSIYSTRSPTVPYCTSSPSFSYPTTTNTGNHRATVLLFLPSITVPYLYFRIDSRRSTVILLLPSSIFPYLHFRTQLQRTWTFVDLQYSFSFSTPTYSNPCPTVLFLHFHVHLPGTSTFVDLQYSLSYRTLPYPLTFMLTYASFSSSLASSDGRVGEEVSSREVDGPSAIGRNSAFAPGCFILRKQLSYSQLYACLSSYAHFQHALLQIRSFMPRALLVKPGNSPPGPSISRSPPLSSASFSRRHSVLIFVANATSR